MNRPELVAGNGADDPLIVLNVRDWSGDSTSDIVIDGLTIHGGQSYALKLADAVKRITVRNSTISGAGADVVAVKGRPNQPRKSHSFRLCPGTK